MSKRLSAEVGTKVTRKRDGRPGFIESRELVVPSVAHPGIWGKTIVTIRFTEDDGIGGLNYSTGDLGWLRSNFKEAK